MFVHESDAACTEAEVVLLSSEPVQGAITIEDHVENFTTFVKPDGAGFSVTDQISTNLIIGRGSAGGVINLGSDAIEWLVGTCDAPTAGPYATHSSMISSNFRPVNQNLPGSNTCLRNLTDGEEYDIHWDSWSCCAQGGFAYTRGTVDVTVLASESFANSELPESIDISGLPDGDYQFCTSAQVEQPDTIDSISYRILDASCGFSGTFEFFLNGVRVGTAPTDPTFSCPCDAATRTISITDPVALSNWDGSGSNELSYVLSGQTLLAWVGGAVSAGGSVLETCITDIGGGNCDEPNLCDAGFDFANGISGASGIGAQVAQDCVPFTKSGEDEIVINGTCNLPPDVSGAAPSNACLWPPNHKFVDVAILGVTDPDGDDVTITVMSITSDEPTASAKGAGGKKHSPDATGVGSSSVSLRAERSGQGDGRVYGISFIANDGNGGEAEGSISVNVPLNQSSKDTCPAVDGGGGFDATSEN
jgi:hypothetical protein